MKSYLIPSKIFSYFLIFIIFIGVGFRFYHITEDSFIYYDEGMWLNQNRALLTLVHFNPPQNSTEFIKIISGLGDYNIYCFKNEDATDLIQWFIGDLAVFRKWYHKELKKCNAGEFPGTEYPNKDGTTFIVFFIYDLPPEFIVASLNLPVCCEPGYEFPF